MALFQSTRYKTSRRDWTNLVVYWECLIPLSQIWGMFTAGVLFGIGVDQLIRRNTLLGINIILSSVGLFSLESHWLLVKLNGCRQPEVGSEAPRCWTLMGDCQHPWNLWKKSAVYWLMSLLLFTRTEVSWLYEASGIQLIVLSALYLLMFIQHELRAHFMRQSTNKGISKIFRIRTISLDAREGEEMAVFERIPETPESEESQQEEDPGLLEILSVEEDNVLDLQLRGSWSSINPECY